MIEKTRRVAALQGRLPDAFDVRVRFRRPILLPSSVSFASAQAGEEIAFAVCGAEGETVHLEGRVRPPQGDLAAAGTVQR